MKCMCSLLRAPQGDPKDLGWVVRSWMNLWSGKERCRIRRLFFTWLNIVLNILNILHLSLGLTPGVSVSHQAVLSHVLCCCQKFELRATDCVLQSIVPRTTCPREFWMWCLEGKLFNHAVHKLAITCGMTMYASQMMHTILRPVPCPLISSEALPFDFAVSQSGAYNQTYESNKSICELDIQTSRFQPRASFFVDYWSIGNKVAMKHWQDGHCYSAPRFRKAISLLGSGWIYSNPIRCGV